MLLDQLLEAHRPEWVSDESKEVVNFLKTLEVTASCSANQLNKYSGDWLFHITIRLPKDNFLPEDTYIKGVIKALVEWLHDKAKSGRYVRVITRFAWSGDNHTAVHIQPEDTVSYLTRLLWDTKFQFAKSPFSVHVHMSPPKQ